MIQSYIIVTFNNKVDPNYLPLIAWFIRDTEKNHAYCHAVWCIQGPIKRAVTPTQQSCMSSYHKVLCYNKKN